MRVDDFHRIVVRNDLVTGLRAMFALHDLTLGPALGGARRWGYGCDADALADVVRLARGMTYKNALAGLPFGGGKSVIVAPSSRQNGPAARPITNGELDRFGEWLDELGGEYVVAEDVGVKVADLARVAKCTQYVTGVGRDGRGGNPGPKTAQGVLVGMEVVAERLGFASLKGVRVAVQGLGNVGMALCEMLHERGAKLTVADIDTAKVTRAQTHLHAVALPVSDVLSADVDIVAPCALGGAITPTLAATMPARAIAGSANNQLSNATVATTLKQRGIHYAPDYVINAGGVISAGLEYLGQDGFEQKVLEIGPRLARIFDESNASGEPESVVAEAMAKAVLARPVLDRVA